MLLSGGLKKISHLQMRLICNRLYLLLINLMRLICPKCGSSRPTPSHKRCPSCRRRLTFANKAAGEVRRIAKWVRNGPLIRCPACDFPSPLGYLECPNCGTPRTASVALQYVAGPAQAWISRTCKGDGHRAKRIGHFLCLVFSLAFFIYGLQQVSDLDALALFAHAAVCFVFVAVIGIVIRFVVPRHVLIVVLLRTSWLIKLSLVLNYTALFLLVWASLADWWSKAVALATLAVVTWGGAWAVASLLWPTTLRLTQMFLYTGVEPFDPTRRQGRTGWHDRG